MKLNAQSLVLVLCFFALKPLELMGQSLEEAIRITLKTNPDIQASAYNLMAAEQLKNQVRGSLLPSIDFVFSGGHEESNNTTTRALGENELDMTRVERSLKITQLLFDGNSTRNLVRQQKALVESALARLLSAKEATTLRAVQVYLEVLRRDEIVRLSEENLGYHDDTLEKIKFKR